MIPLDEADIRLLATDLETAYQLIEAYRDDFPDADQSRIDQIQSARRVLRARCQFALSLKEMGNADLCG